MTPRIVIVTCTLLVGAALIQVLAADEVLPPPSSLSRLAPQLGDWQAVAEHEFDANTVDVLRADDYVARTYARSGQSADLLVAYYASQRQGQTIHSPMNCLPGAGWQPVSTGRVLIDVGAAAPIESNRYVIQKGLDKQLVFYWYQSAHRTVASEYAAKMYLVLDSMRTGRSDGALVRIVSPIGRDEAAAERSALDFVRVLYPALSAHLPQVM
jgi:EpsI family protein